MLTLESRLLQGLGIGMLLVALVTACAPSEAGDPSTDDVIRGEATVEEVDLQIMESFPVQVAAIARGNLSDGCTEIDEVRSSFDAENKTFMVTITTVRDEDAVCTQALVPFEERIALDVRGLSAGTYTVDVNGVRETFTFDVDNELRESSGAEIA